MNNKIVSPEYISFDAPYMIIKHMKKIGVQIGKERMIYSDPVTHKIETYEYPVVLVENKISALGNDSIHLNASRDGEVWGDVECKYVSELCQAGKPLSWEDFIKILWHDHKRMGAAERIEKNHIARKLAMYNHGYNIPAPGHYTIHLHTVSLEDTTKVVRSNEKDVFAINIVWTDDLYVLMGSFENELTEYLAILSPLTSTRLWRMTYETEEESLRPLVDKLNSSAFATAFNNRMSGTFHIECIPAYKETDIPHTAPPAPVPGKRGRTEAPPFETYIKPDAPKGFMKALERMLEGKTGKAAFTIILAINDYFISEPPIKSVLNRFPSVKKTAYLKARDKHFGFNGYYGCKVPIAEKELERLREAFEEELNKEKGGEE
ncbi:MAG: hypothetical protein K5683_07780 [Prevotella sp.]|nr:hypothetical protein [Prevotella sp.]